MPQPAQLAALMVVGASVLTLLAVPALGKLPSPQAGVPEAIHVPGGAPAMTLHAVGAQIYACMADPANGKLSWVFREPIAALLIDGKTIGRHYAGPTWELENGGKIQGKVIARAAGAAPGDIPWLKLEAIWPAAGPLAGMRFIQRIHTQGGALDGPCQQAGQVHAVAYRADYVFLR